LDRNCWGEATQESAIRELVQKTAPDLVVVTPHQDYAVSYWASREIDADEIESSERGFLGAVRKAAQVAISGSKVN
jgi:hypothetical protein